MQAKMSMEGEIAVVHLSGRIDFDSADQFHEVVSNHLAGQKVVFDLTNLDFVGSNAITPFVRSLEVFRSQSGTPVPMFGVGPEFKKIFSARPNLNALFFTDCREALMTFTEPAIDPSQTIG